MNKLFGLFLLALAFLTPDLARAATCFWVGGTGTFSTSNTTSWASGTGGTGGTCAATGGIPKQTVDTATFDGSSGGGTVTVDATMSGQTIGALNAGAFTGTLDFTNGGSGINLTLSSSFTGMNLSGAGARKFLMGVGTFTFTGVNSTVFDLSNVTNLDGTSNFGANFVFTATTNTVRTFAGGGRTYGSLTASSNTSRGILTISGANTFGSLTIGDGNFVTLPQSATTTVTNAMTWTGTSSSPIGFSPANAAAGVATLSIASGSTAITWASIYAITVTGGGTFNATNSFDLGRNTGWSSITPPSGGGAGGRIIGG